VNIYEVNVNVCHTLAVCSNNSWYDTE